jgi:hypothetical protein
MSRKTKYRFQYLAHLPPGFNGGAALASASPPLFPSSVRATACRLAARIRSATSSSRDRSTGLGSDVSPPCEPAELFIDAVGKAGSAIQMHVETAAILVSLLLQHSVPLATVKHSIAGPAAAALALELFTENSCSSPGANGKQE